MIRRSQPMVVVALLVGLLVAPVSTPSAVAQPVGGCANFDALGPAGGFAEFIHHDASRLSDTEGRVAIGGTRPWDLAVPQTVSPSAPASPWIRSGYRFRRTRTGMT